MGKIAKRPKKKKVKPIGKLVEDAAALLQRLVKMKAADDNGYCECVTCGKVDHYGSMHGGHFISRGKAATKLMEENIHPQCIGCNVYGMKNRNTETIYTLWMIDMYGRDEVERMIALSRAEHKWVRCDVDEMIADFKAQIKQQEDRIS